MGKRDFSKGSWKFSNSRKIYLPFYLMALILLGIVGYFYYLGEPVNQTALIAIVVFIVLGIKFTELHRFRNSYEITPSFLLHRCGILNKRVESLDIITVSHIDILQNFWQRILNYGDVKIRVYSTDNVTHMRDVNDPNGVVRFLEKQIESKRTGDTPSISPMPNKTYQRRIR